MQYEYRWEVAEAYDGDSVKIHIDLWYWIGVKKAEFRLWGVNTAEIRGWTIKSKKDAIEARDFVREKILKKQIIFRSIKDWKWKFWRYLAEIFYEKDWKYINLNKELIDTGRAVEFMKWKRNFTTYTP